MAGSSGDVATMARQIERLVERPAWQSDAQIKGDLMKVLGKLTTVRVDVDLLKNTGIGKWVKKLTKYEDDVVRGYSSSLTDKWKAQVGVASEKPVKAKSRAPTREPARTVSPPAVDTSRFENARKNLQDKYAAEKAKRESRTVQMINKPISKRRGTTISAAPSRSSLAARAGVQRRALPTSGRSVSTGRAVTPPPVRRMLGAPASQSRSASAPAGPGAEDIAHRRRRERLLALAQQAKGGNGMPSSSLNGANGRRLPSPGIQKSLPSSRPAPPQQRADPRKALLDRMIPRVCGVSAEASKQAKKRPGSAEKTKPSATSGSKKKPLNYSEGQRDVMQWLKNLDVDMSNYVQAFFDNGFDSIKLLNQIKSRDLESMVPKAGHQRMIESALNDLKRKHATAASGRPRSATRERDLPRRKPRHDSFFDEESDDSFVVSDGDEYAPGAITAMFRKGRKRRYSIDSTDSFNMEASYTEIQNEEERRNDSIVVVNEKEILCLVATFADEPALSIYLASMLALHSLRVARRALRGPSHLSLAQHFSLSSGSSTPRSGNARVGTALSASALLVAGGVAATYSTTGSDTECMAATATTKGPPTEENPVYLAKAEDFLYPSIQPFNKGMLKVSDTHTIYYEECGNPNGKPVVMVHGGPGGGCSETMRRFHDPRVYRIVLFDQRGCGRSLPHASLEENTTWHLVEDMERLRRQLQIEKWQVFGGSWGSTLSTAYAVTHPTRVTELVLRGIFHLRKQELQFYYQSGACFIYPDRWEAYRDAIPVEERGDFIKAYHKRLTSDDPNVRLPAALAWTTWERTTSNLIPPSDAEEKSMAEAKFAEAFARIENHYFINEGFFPNDSFLLDNTYKIRHIPTVVVQGRYDVVCPMRTAWDFHKAFPEADLRVVQTAGHSAMEPGIAKELVAATDRFSKRAY